MESDTKARRFRSPEGIENERVIRDMLPGFLESRGFRDVSDNRKANAQAIVATNPEGDRLTMRVRLCWRRGRLQKGQARLYSAAQILATIGKDD